jgi:multidrug efflux pump subunit AcrA (membrane-fusion protein)
MEADCLSLFALARIFSGYPQEGIAAARTANAISVEIDNTWGQMYSARQLALGLRDIGDYNEALEVAQQGVTLARAQGSPALLLLNLLVSGIIQGSILMQEAAHTTLQEAATINETAQLRSAREAIAESSA